MEKTRKGSVPQSRPKRQKKKAVHVEVRLLLIELPAFLHTQVVRGRGRENN